MTCTACSCYADDANNRKLPQLLAKGVGMTRQACLVRASGMGYTLAGLQNGDECWGGEMTQHITDAHPIPSHPKTHLSPS